MADTATNTTEGSNQNMGLRSKPNKIESHKAQRDRKAGTQSEVELLEMMNDSVMFHNLIDRAELWYRRHEKQYIQGMALLSNDMVTLIEFQMVMRTIQAPFSLIELHVLFRIMDPDCTGLAEYGRLSECLWKVITQRLICELDLNSKDPLTQSNWILMTFKVPSLEVFDTSLTFEELITLDYTGALLRQLILFRRPNLPSRQLVLFTDPSQYVTSVIRSKQRLSSFSYKGGPKTAPTEGVIYYEFSAGHIDCPLLTHNNSLDRTDLREGEKLEAWSTLII